MFNILNVYYVLTLLSFAYWTFRWSLDGFDAIIKLFFAVMSFATFFLLLLNFGFVIPAHL
jgi:hypothetical protein